MYGVPGQFNLIIIRNLIIFWGKKKKRKSFASYQLLLCREGAVQVWDNPLKITKRKKEVSVLPEIYFLTQNKIFHYFFKFL